MPGVGHLEQLVAVLVPRIRAEPVLEALHHRARLRPLPVRVVEVVVERPEVHRQLALQAVVRLGVVRVRAAGDGDRVVVDRIDDEPLVRRRAVGVVRRLAQTPVRDVHHRIGQRERDALAVRLVGLRVLVRPPHRRAHPLIGGHDPRSAEAVLGPAEAALPGRILGDLRMAVIVDANRLAIADALRRRRASRRTRCPRGGTSRRGRPAPCCRPRAAP